MLQSYEHVKFDPDYYEYADISYMARFPNFIGFMEQPVEQLPDGRLIEVTVSILREPGVGMAVAEIASKVVDFAPRRMVRKLKLVNPGTFETEKGPWFFQFGYSGCREH